MSSLKRAKYTHTNQPSTQPSSLSSSSSLRIASSTSSPNHKMSEWVKQYQDTFNANAERVLHTDVPATIEDLVKQSEVRFPHSSPSSMETGGEEDLDGIALASCVLIRDIATEFSERVTILKRYVDMKVPVCADGNNFGVQVQDMVLKLLEESRVPLKTFESVVYDYHWQRGQLLEKLQKGTEKKVTKKVGKEANNSKEDTTEKKSSKEDANESASSSGTSTVKEDVDETTVEVVQEVFTNEHYVKCRTASNVRVYFDNKRAYELVISKYLMIYDTMIKNLTKIQHPRGDSRKQHNTYF
eukprot:TRINITY_DN7424_c0_g1_i1.p1 TRINITY_DN7424_c0_g1~~TRINITY_DN7424_c0_g1_i1.p1  ORF type:complete len:299 (-),score=93.03 TRINITY_DN7424_c0_g1_i1:78-974(-)